MSQEYYEKRILYPKSIKKLADINGSLYSCFLALGNTEILQKLLDGQTQLEEIFDLLPEGTTEIEITIGWTELNSGIRFIHAVDAAHRYCVRDKWFTVVKE